jgi:hypothetical protein
LIATGGSNSYNRTMQEVLHHDYQNKNQANEVSETFPNLVQVYQVTAIPHQQIHLQVAPTYKPNGQNIIITRRDKH